MQEAIFGLIAYAIVVGIPAGFLIGAIENIIKIRKAKNNGEEPAKKNKVGAILFFALFILTIYFYINIYISFTRSIRNM